VGFTWSPSDPWVGDELTFVASASGSPPVSYAWDFGDGETASGEQVLHLYATGGSYAVTLDASNACSQASLTKSVTISSGVQLYLPVISNTP
jgi:PKD repeat protein